MKKTTLTSIFFRSFFIHATLNFRRMQNMGFGMALIPMIRELRLQKKEAVKILTAHLQMFNTHPYLSAPIIGSIVRLEEDRAAKGENPDTASIRQSLMASYAAIGDIFFWGAFRPFAAIVAVLLVHVGLAIAPVIFLLIYTPAHLWVRLKGFIEGYRKGKNGFEFIRALNLPVAAVRVRWMTLMVLAGLMIWLARDDGYRPFGETYGVVAKLIVLATVMFCYVLIKKGISQIYIVYGAVLAFMMIFWAGWMS